MGGCPDEIRAGILEVGVDLPEQAEDPYERVLSKIFAVPEIPGEAAAVAVQIRPKRGEAIQVAPPRSTNLGLNREGSIGKGHGLSCALLVVTAKTTDDPKRIRPCAAFLENPT